MSNSLADSVEILEWNDNGSETAFPTLDDVIKNVENFDDSLSFLEGSDGTSLLGSAFSPPPTTNLSYQTDSGVSSWRLDAQSHQLSSLANKSGNATSICVSGPNGFMAVGGSRGMIMLFNPQGRLETFFAGEEESGSVGCIAFSEDGKYLAAGYGRGIVKIFSIKRGSLIHTMKDTVQPGTGVLQIVYLDTNQEFLTLDSGGNVFEIRLKNTLMRRISHSTKCVFSGCNGEVLNMHVILRNIIVLLTVTKVLIITTQKGGSILAIFPASTFDPHPPLFDYHIVNEKSKFIQICMARGDKLKVFALYPDKFGTKQKVAALLKIIHLPKPIVALSWITHNGILTFDQNGITQLISPERGLISRGLPQELSLTFSTTTFKALESGGSISVAMSLIAELVCYHSICRTGNQIIILTHEGIFTIRPNNELDQLALYEDRGDMVSSCLFLLDLVKGRIRPTATVQPKLDTLTTSFLHKLAISISLEDSESPDQTRKNMNILLHVGVESSHHSVIYEFAWPLFEEKTHLRSLFLESLDEFVLDGNLEFAPPSLVSAYLQYLTVEGHFSQLQSAICRFDISSIDIHMVMTVCRQNNLYDGIIHVMNKALGDFIAPLEEMLEVVGEFSFHDVKSDFELEQGNRLLLYIQCCLAGNGYPLGGLPDQIKNKVPIDVYRCITSIRGKDGSSSSQKYPYLRTLLLFDAQQFFHVISTCIDSSLFVSSDGRLQRLMDMLGELCDSIGTVDILVQYFIAIIRLLESSKILASIDLLERCVCTLLRSTTLPETAEIVVLDLMGAVPQINQEVILRLAHHPFKFRICTYIYFSQRRFLEILKAIISADQKTKELIFSVVQKILQAELSQEELVKITEYLKSHLFELGDIDAYQTALLILDNFAQFSYEFTTPKNDEKAMFFPILQAAFDIRKERQENYLTGDEEQDEKIFDVYFEGLIEILDTKDNDLKEILIHWLPMGSKSDYCLNIAMPNGKLLTCVLLLEARGFTNRAFNLIFEQLSQAFEENELVIWIDELLGLVSRNTVEANEDNWLIKSFREIVKHCKNSSDEETDHRLETLIRRIMSGGSQHAFELFTCILDYPSFHSSNLSKSGALIRQILSSCEYEKMLLSAIFKSTEHENSFLIGHLKNQISRRTQQLTILVCYICQEALKKSTRIYRCGHAVHLDCDTGQKTCPCSDSKKPTNCSIPMLRQKANLKIKRDIFGKQWHDDLKLSP